MDNMEKATHRTSTAQDMFSGQWRQMRGTLRSWWGKLTDDDWERIGGQKDKLLGVLQEKYAYTRDMAEREIERRFNEYSGQSGSTNAGTTAGIQQKAENFTKDAQAKVHELNARASEGLNEAKAAVGKKIGSLAETIRTTLPQEGSVGSATQSVANSLSAAGSYLEEHTFEDFSKDMTSLIRRYPLQSLLVGVGIGYLMSRGSER